MNETLALKLKRLKHAFRKRVDPRGRVIAAFDLIRLCMNSKNYEIPAGSDELEATRFAALIVVQNLGGLASLAREFKLADTPRSRDADDWADSLQINGVDQDDILRAMDFASEAFNTMLETFSRAKFQDLDLALETYDERKERQCAQFKCAALLPVLVHLTADVWNPLRKKISEVERG